MSTHFAEERSKPRSDESSRSNLGKGALRWMVLDVRRCKRSRKFSFRWDQSFSRGSHRSTRWPVSFSPLAFLRSPFSFSFRSGIEKAAERQHPAAPTHSITLVRVAYQLPIRIAVAIWCPGLRASELSPKLPDVRLGNGKHPERSCCSSAIV